jgi:hypothetical protein
MWLVGIVLNPMNLMAYRWSDLYLSKTLVLIGFVMASNMMWVHSILHYMGGDCSMNECVITVIMGICLAGIAVYVLRN